MKSTTKTVRQQLGEWAEQTARHVLGQQGYVCLSQNYHSRFGEIDLIAQNIIELSFR